MVERRAWSGAEHRAAVAAHPVVGPLAEGLVWHIEAPDAAPVLVRTAELGEYLDVDAEPCAVADGARVSLPHPLDLSDAERDAWRRHLDDHELVQPVEQLDRAVFGRVAGGPPAPGGRVHGGSLVSLMERHGWRRDFDERVRGHLWRPFVAHGVAVVLVLDPGLTTGALHESAPQRVSGVLLQPADRPDAWAREQRSWDLVDALVVSEVRRSLAAIAAKAE